MSLLLHIIVAFVLDCEENRNDFFLRMWTETRKNNIII